MKEQDDPLELVGRVLTDAATQEELTDLENRLRDDPEFRKEYLRYLAVDSALASKAKETGSPKIPDKPPVPATPFLKWSPLATAASVGLVAGLFCASFAWAIMVPKTPAVRQVIPILSESFEGSATALFDGFPTQTGVWGGNQAKVVGADPERLPAHGKSMLRLETSPDSNLGYIQQIIDVTLLPQPKKGKIHTLEAVASFLPHQLGEKERYTLRVATFTESPEEIRSLWEGVPWRDMDASTLTMAKTGRYAPPEQAGWQTLSAVVKVPAKARSLVISLAAGRLDKAAPKTPHYLDDVHANLIISPFKKMKRKINVNR